MLRYLNAMLEIHEATEFLTNHPTLKERQKLLDLMNSKMKTMTLECTRAMGKMLKGEHVNYIPAPTNIVDPEMKEELYEKYFMISPKNLTLLKAISTTLKKCGRYTFMNECRQYMAMFLKRTMRGIKEVVKSENLYCSVYCGNVVGINHQLRLWRMCTTVCSCTWKLSFSSLWRSLTPITTSLLRLCKNPFLW